MQLFNKEASKRIFTHTWYIYPLLIGIIAVIWLWGFQAFHQPSAHQSLLMFFSTNINNNNFTKEIMNEYYAREDLRQIDAYYSLPDLPSYVDKLNLYIRKSDILVLNKKTIDDLRGYQERFFVEFDQKLLDKYFLDPTQPRNYEYYTYTDTQGKDYIYGIKIKDKTQEDTYLDTYMTFDNTYDYYLCLGASSVNLGYLGGEANEKYDNALTYSKHLLDKQL